MSVMHWNFKLREGYVSVLAVVDPENGVPYEWYEEIKPGGNFCGIKYYELAARKEGVLEVSWLRFNKWREER